MTVTDLVSRLSRSRGYAGLIRAVELLWIAVAATGWGATRVRAVHPLFDLAAILCAIIGTVGFSIYQALIAQIVCAPSPPHS